MIDYVCIKGSSGFISQSRHLKTQAKKSNTFHNKTNLTAVTRVLGEILAELTIKLVHWMTYHRNLALKRLWQG